LNQELKFEMEKFKEQERTCFSFEIL